MAPKYAMSDSEDEDVPLAPSAPSDETLERGLRDTVAQIYKSGKMEELTVKRVRLATEKSLGLEEGFFKSNSDWKTKSEDVIRDEVETQDQSPKESDHEAKASPPAKTAKPTKRAKPESKSKASSKSNKRRKTSASESEEEAAASESEKSEEDISKPARKPAKAAQKSKDQVEDDESADEEEKPPKEEAEPKDESESEMSVVLDEEPQLTRKRKSAEGPAKGKKKAPAKAPAKEKAPAKGKDANIDPDQAEIKRLQGWLLKCGIRKMWARELAPYDTAKAKIKHLKEMLKDAGMEGRYSQEKANKIREERELKADLDQIQEGAKQWGAEESDDNKPRRRLNRGRKSLAFLEDDGEETD